MHTLRHHNPLLERAYYHASRLASETAGRRTDPMHEEIALEICADCLQYIANGEEPQPLDPEYWDEAHEWSTERVNETWKEWNLCIGPTQEVYDGYAEEHGSTRGIEDGWFSWQGCECCERGLGGDRYHATAYREVTILEQLGEIL